MSALIVRGLQLLVMMAASNLFVCLFAIIRILRVDRSRTACLVCVLFGALAVEAFWTAVPVLAQLGRPIPVALYRIRGVPLSIWFRVGARLGVSAATWLLALHLSGVDITGKSVDDATSE